MTKTTSSSNTGCLIVIFPFAVIVTVLFIAWRVLLTMLIGGLGWRLWQNYQWKQFSLQINPFFHSLLLENQGSITPLDLALKANISGMSAKNYLEAKAKEFGAQRQEYENKGTVYYFLTSGTLGRIFDDSEPVGLFSPVEKNSIKSESVTVKSENLPTEQEIKTPVVEEIVAEIKIITSEEKTEEHRSVIVDSETEIQTPESVVSSSVIADSETEIQTTVTEVVTNLETESGEISEVEISPIEPEKNNVSESVQEPIQILTVSGLGQILDDSEPDNLSKSKVEDSQNVTTEKKSLSLYQKDLAERLGVSSATILRYRIKTSFANWSKEKDPEGIAWQYSPKTGFFTPINE